SVSPALAVEVADAESKAVTKRTAVRALRIDEPPGVLEVFFSDGVGRPIRQRAYSQGRVVTGVLRKGACPQHEKVRHVPALQIPVKYARIGIRTHDGTAVQVRRLIGRYVVGPRAILHRKLVCAHRLDDLGEFVGQELVLLDLVLLEIHG